MKVHLVVIAALASCVPTDPPPGEPDVIAAGTKGECPDAKCGTNSPIIDGIGFHELSINGGKNRQGFYITHVTLPSGWSGPSPYIQVTNGEIHAKTTGTTPLDIHGFGVEGTVIYLGNDDPSYAGIEFALSILATKKDVTWAKIGGLSRDLYRYTFGWAKSTDAAYPQPNTKLCVPDPSLFPPSPTGMQPYESFVFEGERIHAEERWIEPVLDPKWFNIGCSGSALSKMVYEGHTHAAEASGFVTTIPERIAILKMFSGDYCGHGRAFTIPGEPLDWIDDRHTMSYAHASTDLKIEARWNQDGAVCLNQPRLEVHHGSAGDPDYKQIGSECLSVGHQLPACSDVNVDHVAPYHLTSANPP